MGFFALAWRIGEWHPVICRPVGAFDGMGVDGSQGRPTLRVGARLG